jgi:pimeloyl-ACP methyl ester carboxylesterase
MNEDASPNEAWPMESIRLNVNNMELNVNIAGQGEPVMLLHGFPDSAELWRLITPILVQAGYRVIAPDQRGFGRSEAPAGVEHYKIKDIAQDAVAILDRLEVKKAKLVGHDWGASIGWWLAGNYADRFDCYAALSVGHPKAFASGGFQQKLKSWYMLVFQIRGLAEAVLRAGNWWIFRKYLNNHPELERHWIPDLSRPGRLTVALNWYRANFEPFSKSEFPNAKIPVMGVWSSRDVALAETQMVKSAAYVDSLFRYERIEDVGHWMMLDAPDVVGRLLIDCFGRKGSPT